MKGCLEDWNAIKPYKLWVLVYNSRHLYGVPQHRGIVPIVKPTRCTNISDLFYFGMTHCMFRTVFPSIIRSSRLYIQQQTFVKQCCVLASGYKMELQFHLVPASKQTALFVWKMPVAICTVLNSWWWTERPSEKCRMSFQNKINLIHWCI